MTLRDPVFWPAMQVARESRQPLDHLLCWFQRPFTPGELEATGGHMALLQSSKASSIAIEFCQVVARLDSQLGRMLEQIPADLREGLAKMAAHLPLQAAAAFHRRLAVPVNRRAAYLAHLVCARLYELVTQVRNANGECSFALIRTRAQVATARDVAGFFAGRDTVRSSPPCLAQR